MPRRKGNQYATIEFENYEEGTIAKISENVPELTFRRPYMVGASGGEYAIFAGGNDESSYSVAATSQVDAYDKNLAHIVPAELSVARQYIAATTGENYTLFGGGHDYDGSVEYYFSTVDAYSMTLVHTTPTELSESKRDVAATTVGKYSLFAGGRTRETDFQTVDVYDNNLVHTTAGDLHHLNFAQAATTVGNYALIVSGYAIDAYNQNLVRMPFQYAPDYGNGVGPGTTVGNYALFNRPSRGPTVLVYTRDLVNITPISLNQERPDCAATRLRSFALFGGGVASGATDISTVEGFDNKLARHQLENLYLSRVEVAATVGNYSLFPGSNSKINTYEYTLTELNLELTLYKGTKYKFQGMDAEATVEADMETKTIATPATGYIKLKKVTLF